MTQYDRDTYCPSQIAVIVVVLLLPKEGVELKMLVLAVSTFCTASRTLALQMKAEVHARSDARPVKELSIWKENDDFVMCTPFSHCGDHAAE